MRKRNTFRLLSLLALVCFCLGIRQAAGQSRVVDATVHSPGLEHNLLGDSADQPVAIVLPEAYEKNPTRRFSVLYFLHGYSDLTPRHEEAEMLRKQMDAALANGSAQPFIIVLPNGINKYLGSFYINSSSTGNWDDYMTRDVVAYVDQHFRTEPNPEHRAIAGHSMGGYGALTLAFRHPDVFGLVYALSPCCTDLVGDLGPSNPAWPRVAALGSPDQARTALNNHDFYVAAYNAMAAALAPDPTSKSLGDLPFSVESGRVTTNPAGFSRMAMNMPANMVLPLLANIVRLKGISIDYGAQDNFSHIPLGAQEVAARLSQAGVSNTLEVYEGDHGNRIEERIREHLLPWASQRVAR